MTVISGGIALLGRLLLALLFIIAGIGKAMAPAATGAYLGSMGLPANLAWPVALFEIIGGLFILFGIATRITALALAVFCVLTALMAHSNFADPVQATIFWKNIAIAGGFLMIVAYGTMAHSYDAYRERRRIERERVVVERRDGVRETVDVCDRPIA